MPRYRRALGDRRVVARRRAFLQTRSLQAEQLEARSLLAGDVMPYHNDRWSTDVNDDGYVAPDDALLVINNINRFGARQLEAPAATAQAEGEGPVSLTYYDVDNDGYITATDALRIINALNGEGDPDVMRFRIAAVPIGTADTFKPSTTTAPADLVIDKGTDYEFRVFVQDISGPTGQGVFAAFGDVNYEDSLSHVFVKEVQHVTISGTPTGGTFRLTYAGQTTAPIAFDTFDTVQVADDMRVALEGLSNIGVGDVDVVYDPLEDEQGNPIELYRWKVRFQNALGNQDVANMTGDATGMTGTGVQVTVVETGKGVITDPVAFREAFTTTFRFPNALSAGSSTDQIDELGAISSQGLNAGTQLVEMLRVRMTTNDAGMFDFTVNQAEILPAHRVLLFNRDTPVDPIDIDFGFAQKVIINEYVSALPDTFNGVAEQADISLDVFANNGAGVDSGTVAFTINGLATASGGAYAATATTALGGTVTITNGGTRIRYQGPAGVSGQDTFSYRISDGTGRAAYTDTTVVTLNIAPSNDAPVNTVPGAQTLSEGGTRVFNAANGNLISVADADSANVQVTLSVSSLGGVAGRLTLSTVANLVVSGNNTNNVVLSGAVADVNAALNGLTYSPVDPDVNNTDTGSPVVLTITTSDQFPGTPGVDTDMVSLNVTPLNDAPVNTVPGAQTTVETDPVVFSGANLITVADVDLAEGSGSHELQVTLTTRDAGNAPTGGLTLATIAGLSFTAGDGTNDPTLTFTGSLTNVRNALNGMTFVATDLFVGAVTLTITTNDQGNSPAPALQDVDTVTITVNPGILPRAVNDNPAAFNEDPGAAQIFNVLANDRGRGSFQKVLLGLRDSGNNLVSTLNLPEGTVTVLGLGTPTDGSDDFIEYTPAANFNGSFSFNYEMSDTDPTPLPMGAQTIASVNVVVNPVNDAPQAMADNSPVGTYATYTTAEETLLSITAAGGPGVLANDSDPDLETLTAVGLTANPIQAVDSVNGAIVAGSVTLNSDGSFSFQPANNYNGTAVFQYQARDPQGALSAATNVFIVVTPVNDAPTANPQTVNTNEETAVGITLTGSDPEMSPLTFTVVGLPTKGMLSGTAPNLTYTPSLNQTGVDTFTFRVNDGTVDSPLATVTINIANVNDQPTANPDGVGVNFNFLVSEGGTLTTTAAQSVLLNDTDPDTGDTLTAVKVSDATVVGTGAPAGTVTLNANGTFTYTPSITVLADTLVEFQYQARDNGTPQLTSPATTVRITVTPFNDPPQVSDKNYTGANGATEGTPLNVNAANGLLVGVVDPDSSAFTPSVVAQPPATQGTVTVNPDGSFTFQPFGDFYGQTSFTYKVNDGEKDSNVATVTISVAEVNDNPTAMNDPVSGNVLAGQPVVISVLANDSIAPDNLSTPPLETLQIIPGSIVAGPGGLNGTATLINGNTQIQYTPDATFQGQVTFTYTIGDFSNPGGVDRGGRATATVTVNVIRFTPAEISGRVTESRGYGIAGVKITLTAQNDMDAFGNPVAPIPTTTDVNGRYAFPNLAPGTYFITETQPAGFVDGEEEGSVNDQITVTIPMSGAAQVTGKDFHERTIETQFLTIEEITNYGGSSEGLMMALRLNNPTPVWSVVLGGWGNVGGVVSALLSDANTLNLTLEDATGADIVLPTLHRLGNPRFRIMGIDGQGNVFVRLDGGAANYGLAALMAASGEGEGEQDDYPAGADEVFSNW